MPTLIKQNKMVENNKTLRVFPVTPKLFILDYAC